MPASACFRGAAWNSAAFLVSVNVGSTTSWRDLERPPGRKLGLLVAILFFIFLFF